MSIEQIIDLYKDNPDRFHFEGELRALNRLAAGVEPPNVIVEIGSYRGQSTCALALHAQMPVFSIDDHSNAPEDVKADGTPLFSQEDRKVWMENVLAVGRGAVVRPIDLPSSSVAQIWGRISPIGLLFIDGAHDYDNVATDLRSWLPRMAEGGLLALHDNNKEGVMQAAQELLSGFEVVEVADVTTVYRVRDGLWIQKGGSASYKEGDEDLIGRQWEFGVPVEDNANANEIAMSTNASPKVVTRRPTRKPAGRKGRK